MTPVEPERLFAPPPPVFPPKLRERFGMPPFSVIRRDLDYYLERKRLWGQVLPDSGEGREGALTWGEKKLFESNGMKATSTFDPVLAELAIAWYSAEGMNVLDPFAGGSVRGLVSSFLWRKYIGYDVNRVQVGVNREHGGATARIFGVYEPCWVEGDIREFPLEAEAAPKADLVFTCPPYWNLERYSDDPRDLSTIDHWGRFKLQYREVLRLAFRRLRRHRFAVIVVGNVREGWGPVRDLAGYTTYVASLEGLDLYNDAVIVGPLGSAAQRAATPFETSRKLTRVHQFFQVYVKGDWREAAEAVKEGE